MADALYEPSFFAKLKETVRCCRKPRKEADKTPEEQRTDSKEKQVQDLREFFRELGVYLLMLCCFSLSIWMDSSSIQKHNMASTFMEAVMPAGPPASVDSFFSMMYSHQNSTGVCAGILCRLTTPDYFSSEVNRSSGASDFFGSLLLGQIRLRQIRVQKVGCSSFYQTLESIDCFPDFGAGAEETTFTKEWAPDFDTSVDPGFKWQSQADVGEVGNVTVFATRDVTRARVCITLHFFSSCIRLSVNLLHIRASSLLTDAAAAT
jgi:hypothetical protein